LLFDYTAVKTGRAEGGQYALVIHGELNQTMPDAERHQSFPPAWLKALLIGRRPRTTLVRLAVLVILSVIVFGFILLPSRITGPSMLPTYQDGSINFVNRLAFLFHEPRRGDIVSIRFSGTSVMLCKRIIGLPGESVEFARGRVLINGRLLDEPYVKYPCDWNHDPVRLGLSQYYVVGDNRSMPADLHEHGAVERERIVGRMLL